MERLKEIESELLKEIFDNIPDLSKTVKSFLKVINSEAALKNEKGNLFLDDNLFPNLIIYILKNV